MILEMPDLTPETCKQLLDYYQDFHRQNLQFFISLRTQWHAQNPGKHFPGLCANINPITGEFRPAAEQRAWGWGDTRALGVWCSFFILNRVPGDLLEPLANYCDTLYIALSERLEKNNGAIPFSTSIETNLPDNEPRNRPLLTTEADFSLLFGSNAFMQYGMWMNNQEIFDKGSALFFRCCKAIAESTFIFNYSKTPPIGNVHGTRMIALGVIGEVLKSMQALGDPWDKHDIRAQLIATALEYTAYITTRHFTTKPPGFWEFSDGQGHPVKNEAGIIQVDPGHATECAGFMAELAPFLSKPDKKAVLETALAMHLFADSIGFAPTGVMYKSVDLYTGNPLPDTQTVKSTDKPTAPWWNVREHSATALRLYTLTKDARCLESYKKAQNASYLYYPSKKIPGLMVQTLDPETLEVVDVPPATGNIDAMHDPRARVREMENLELLIQHAA